MTNRVRLPEPVAHIYKATAALEGPVPGQKIHARRPSRRVYWRSYRSRSSRLDALPKSRPGHDAYDANGDVQIKMTAGSSIALYAISDRLVVLRVVPPEEAEIIYDGPGKPVWRKQARRERTDSG
jgi:hypothetical protein